ncbi:MAG: hypothetical protein K5945_10295 [Bacteroidaceae bacterium]|nr:hypothetical protein [Bacteroidaceae bacterium]
MKRIIYLLIMIWAHLFYLDIYAHEVRMVNVKFEESAFKAIRDSLGHTAIISDSMVCYKHDGFSPMLPYIPLNYCIPTDMSYDSISVEPFFYAYADDVIMAVSQMPLKCANFAPNMLLNNEQHLDNITFPQKNVEYIGETVVGEYKMISFWVCPFQYNQMSKKLFFSDSIDIKIHLKNNFTKTDSKKVGDTQYNLLSSLIYNSWDIEPIDYIEEQKSSSNEPIVEYVIITGQSLKNAFKPLVDWKKMKGVNSTIITVESIDTLYTSGTTQQKIKQCLYDFYNQGLKYALLGGDVDIVPEQICALIYHLEDENGVQIDHQEYNDMPTDLYYACFDGNFYWNANGNDSIGEPDDGVSMVPNIYVTRVPVKTSTDVSSFVNKIIQYEKTPSINGWNNSFLTCGNTLLGNYIPNPTKSDAEAIGDIIYNNYIQPYWSGNRVRFYDTNTDFSGGSSYQLNKNNLKTQLSQGYPFVQMLSHGQVRYWRLEGDTGDDQQLSSPYVYSIDEGSTQTNNASTIITTIACWTNAFNDPDYTCLSESLINNPESGVIAYLGCSEEGFIDSTNYGSINFSNQYEAQYYSKLFSPNSGKKSFGKIVAEAKAQMINASLANFYYRWIQYGLNPIGDPEMPIYTSTPQIFGNTNVTLNNNSISINTGVNGCTICIMSIDDFGESYYKVATGVNTATFNDINTDVSICITKQGYIPKTIEIRDILRIQNRVLTTDTDFYGREIYVGSNVNPSETSGPVIFNNGSYKIKGNKVILHPGTKISIGAKMEISR